MSSKSRILFIAPRYHTNFRFQIKKLIDEGHIVKFISIGIGATENHDIIKPTVIGLSKLGEILDNIINSDGDIAKRNVKGLPKIFTLYKEVLNYKPDYIITRSFNSTYFRVLLPLFLIKRYNVNIYVQNPKFASKLPLVKRLYFLLLTKVFDFQIFTTVKYLKKQGEPDNLVDNEFYEFIPFFINSHVDQHFIEKKDMQEIKILHIGKFIKRKNHELVLKAFLRVRKKIGNCRLIIIGESSDIKQAQHMAKLRQMVQNSDFPESVEIYSNVPNTEIEKFYKQAHLFLLLSINETASISQIEAMSYGLPVICSIDNGTAHYVKDSVNGYVIEPEEEQLLNKLEDVLESPEKIKAMSIESLDIINMDFNIDRVFRKFIMFIKRER